MSKGRITHWNAQKGYGFITPSHGGKNIFFHISTWQSQKRPSKGLQVSYEETLDDKNRLATRNVSLLNENRKKSFFVNVLRNRFQRRLIAAIIVLIIAIFVQIFSSGLNHDDRQTNREFAETNDTQVVQTLALIAQGGPFPYPDRDGRVFQNREKRLPAKPNGYYREYTVPTLEVADRGARRIVTGGNPPEVFYYTADHYETFQQLEIKQ